MMRIDRMHNVRARSLLTAVTLAFVTAPWSFAAGDDEGVAKQVQGLQTEHDELERRLDLLAGELERLQLGEVAPPVGESFSGLGPAASKVYSADGGLSVGGYGEVLYQNFRGGSTDDFDFLRAVLYFGYKFDEHWVVNTEIELEHADEVFLEFATIDYLYRPWFNVRAGLVLIPMGFMNELHEPTTFFSARRTDVESFILPSTWRENGAGFFGDCGDFSYRAYVVNGFAGDQFRSSNGLRNGRQKGSQTDSNDFGAVARADWVGIPGLMAGGSYYFGHSGQDAPVDGDVSIVEAHVEASARGFRFRGLYTQAHVDDVLGLNQAAGLVDGMGVLAPGVSGTESIGRELEGGYLELGYDVLSTFECEQSLTPFVRYEVYDLQKGVPAPFIADGSRDVRVNTLGIAWSPIPNIVFKADFQNYDTDANGGENQFNLSGGYVF